MTYSEPERSPGHMRAADADRTAVADLLSAAYAEGRITRDEHDARLAQTMDAKTFDDLRGVTADLVPSGNQGRSIGAISAAGTQIDRSGASSESDLTLAIFGGVSRSGRWRARRQITSVTLFGGSEFDFNDATFESDVIELTVFCAFGGVDLKVPAGVNVHNEAIAVFGGIDVKRLEPQPGAPTIVIKGLVLFGGVDVKGPKARRDRCA